MTDVASDLEDGDRSSIDSWLNEPLLGEGGPDPEVETTLPSSKTNRVGSGNFKQQWQVIPTQNLRVGRIIGKGAYGMVFQGTFHGNPVAIKELDR